jgi:antitoxin PrlF
MSMEAKVTSKGQVTLPIALRARLAIEPGDCVVFVEQADGTFTLRVHSGTFADLRGMLSGKVAQPADAHIAQWIDEARSRALARSAKKRRR